MSEEERNQYKFYEIDDVEVKELCFPAYDYDWDEIYFNGMHIHWKEGYLRLDSCYMNLVSVSMEKPDQTLVFLEGNRVTLYTRNLDEDWVQRGATIEINNNGL